MTISNIIDSLFGFVFNEEPVRVPVSRNGIKRVAAGDPAMALRSLVNPDSLPSEITRYGDIIKPGDFDLFEVVGSSMAPEGVENGDILLCSPVDPENLPDGNFYAVIAVDQKYYEHKGKSTSFKFKLRQTICPVGSEVTVDDLLNKLPEIAPAILIEDNKASLRKKFNEARSFYGLAPLMLSLTYKSGSLRFSFHPIELIRFKAEYLLKPTGDGWSCQKV